MRSLLGLFALAFFSLGCGDGADGGAGRDAAACTARQVEAGLSIRCPGSDEVVVAAGDCDASQAEDGSIHLRCDDGTEATLPSTGLGVGAVRGRVVGLGGDAIAAAQVEIVGLDLGTTTGADGRFHLDDVPGGVWTLQVTHAPWLPAEVEGVVVLPGVFDAGTVVLGIGMPLVDAGEIRLIGDTTIHLVQETGGLRIRVLATGEEQLLEAEVGGWETVEGALQIAGAAPSEAGFWSPEHGFVWWTDLEFPLFGGDRMVAWRSVGPRSWLLSSDGSEQLISSTTFLAWRQNWDEALWWTDGGATLIVVDGRGEVPRITELPIGSPRTVAVRGGGLVVVEAGGTQQYYSAISGARLPVPDILGDVDVQVELVRWVFDEELHVYDLRTNLHRTLPVGTPTGTSPRQLFFHYRDAADDRFVVEDRLGAEVARLPTPIGSFSPEESRLARIVVGDRIFLHDLETGEEVMLEIAGAGDPRWVDEDWLVVPTPAGAVVAGWDGRTFVVEDLPPGAGAIAGRHFIVQRADHLQRWDLETLEPSVVGPFGLMSLSPDGRWLLWTSPGGRLLLQSMVSSEKLEIDAHVEEAVALSDVFLWRGRSWPEGEQLPYRAATYP